MSSITIRLARATDAKAIASIYAYYVTHTAITFEYHAPSEEEIKRRMQETLKTHPYLVATKDDRLIGFSYASPLRKREAYQFAVETTIYLDPEEKRQGIGTKLYQTLEEILRRQNVTNLYARIASTDHKSPYLTKNSEHFHQSMGYQINGKFSNSGYKFNQWFDMIWMEKNHFYLYCPCSNIFSNYRVL